MSNPAVIKLQKTNVSGMPVWLDDNIGESIHVHYGDNRVDLTNAEFKVLNDDLCEAINSLVNIEGFDCKKINPIYFKLLLAKDILKLEKITIDEMRIKDMFVAGKDGMVSIPNSRGVKALEGNPEENDVIRDSHHIGQTSEDRLNRVLRSIQEHGYPYQGEYIIFYNDENIIRDGQHRASCLWHLYGDISVPVMRFYMKDIKPFSPTPRWQRSVLGRFLISARSAIKQPISFTKKHLYRIKKQLNKKKKEKYYRDNIEKYKQINYEIIENR